MTRQNAEREIDESVGERTVVLLHRHRKVFAISF